MRCSDPSPIHQSRRRRWHLACTSQCARGPRSRSPQWTVSAWVWRDLAGSGSHRHQRHPPRRWPASAHNDRSRSARSSRGPATAAVPVPPAKPRPHDNRCPSVGHAPIMALGTVRQFGSIDVGDAHPLAPAADSVSVVDGGRKTQDCGSKKDGHTLDPRPSLPVWSCYSQPSVDCSVGTASPSIRARRGRPPRGRNWSRPAARRRQGTQGCCTPASGRNGREVKTGRPSPCPGRQCPRPLGSPR